jgi:hypothetical protein
LNLATIKNDEPSKINFVNQSDGTVSINLDNSVFRNFKRLKFGNILKCVENDTRFWIG